VDFLLFLVKGKEFGGELDIGKTETRARSEHVEKRRVLEKEVQDSSRKV